MTRKDYIAIANAIQSSHDHIADDDQQGHKAVELVAELVADTLANGNERFDRRRFIRATRNARYDQHLLTQATGIKQI